MILPAPAIVRASSLDGLFPTLKYNARVIIVDGNGDFLGFACRSLQHSPDGTLHNFFFDKHNDDLVVAGIRHPDYGTAWFDSGPKLIPAGDLLFVAARLGDRLI